jgi:hypothetical protein
MSQAQKIPENVFGGMKIDRILHPHSFPRETGVLYVDRRPRVLVLQIAHHQANLFEPRGVLRLEYLLNGLPTPVTAHRSAVIKIELFERNVVQRVLL